MRHCTQACFANSQALCWCVALLMVLLSWICKDTVILVFWKDLPWKPNNESRKLNHKASTATCFYSHPLHTQPLEMMAVFSAPTYFHFCKMPRQSTNHPPAAKAQPTSLESPQPRESPVSWPQLLSLLPQLVCMTWKYIRKKLWTDISPNFIPVTRLRCHRVVCRVW